MTKQLYLHGDGFTPEELKKLFTYRDGNLYWRHPGSGRRMGQPTGSLAPSGYRYIGITRKHQTGVTRKNYLAHRLIWIFHGNSPAYIIDHINNDRADNRIENLRAVTSSQNCMNRRQRSDNVSGVKGVSWDNVQQKWRVRVAINGRDYCGGRFFTKEEAAAAAVVLRRRLHGEFGRC